MRAVFFDRDNTLTIDEGYCYKVSDFAWMKGAEAALARLHAAQIPVFIVTNQGGIARGLFGEDDMIRFHDHLCAKAQEAGGHITDIAFCPHHPQSPDETMRSCTCRKPEAGLFFALAAKWDIDLANSVMIGDRDSDVIAGKRAGCHAYLSDKDSVLDDLVKQIIETHFTTTPSARV